MDVITCTAAAEAWTRHAPWLGKAHLNAPVSSSLGEREREGKNTERQRAEAVSTSLALRTQLHTRVDKSRERRVDIPRQEKLPVSLPRRGEFFSADRTEPVRPWQSDDH